MSKEAHSKNVFDATQSVQKAAENVNPRFRQRYHFMAPAYWLNDPNGLIQFQGEYHLFYQHNPYAAKWGPMHWGHAVSSDMVHWKHLPLALAPSEPYESGESGGCFSGSAVESGGKLVLFYTGARTLNGKEQTQCMAFSVDGIRFEKYGGNPVLRFGENGAEDFRDPKVWRHDGYWYMAAASTERGSGEIRLYESPDLIHWTPKGIPVQGNGRMGDMWECPDYFEIGEKGIFFFSPVHFPDHKSSYLTGRLNYETGEFTPDVFGETDYGFDFYAAQSLHSDDGRRIIIGWCNSWDWMPWWNGYGPTQEDSWCGFMSLPREVLLGKDGRLSFQPIEELKALRETPAEISACSVEPGCPLELRAGDGIHFEMKAEFNWKHSSAHSCEILLRSSENERTVLAFDFAKKEMVFDRTGSDHYSKGKKRCNLKMDAGENLAVHIFSDTCSLEVLTDSGNVAFSSSLYPSTESRRIFLAAEGGRLSVCSIKTWEMKSIDSDTAEQNKS